MVWYAIISMVICIRLILNYNKIVEATNKLIKQNSSHLDISHFKLNNNATYDDVCNNLSKIASIIDNHHFAHIIFKKNKIE